MCIFWTLCGCSKRVPWLITNDEAASTEGKGKTSQSLQCSFLIPFVRSENRKVLFNKVLLFYWLHFYQLVLQAIPGNIFANFIYFVHFFSLTSTSILLMLICDQALFEKKIRNVMTSKIFDFQNKFTKDNFYLKQ